MIHSPLHPPVFSNCTSEERLEKLSRYRNKKTKRNFGRKIKVMKNRQLCFNSNNEKVFNTNYEKLIIICSRFQYACRKALADSQPRIRGRFAKTDESEVKSSSSISMLVLWRYKNKMQYRNVKASSDEWVGEVSRSLGNKVCGKFRFVLLDESTNQKPDRVFCDLRSVLVSSVD